MKTIFEKQNFQENTIESINLLLGINFDGAQVYSTTTCDFSPLYISIENLPPILRSKVGMGMFMLSLFTKKLHSKCYDFIFYDCLTKELHEFEKGMLIHTENKTYFVQARLIIHRYDTKSFEYICNVQGTASLNGCTKCDLCPG